MNIYEKIRDFCKKFRIALGVILIIVAIITGNSWFYLGIIPLIVGITNFCPLCIITKKCRINTNNKKKK